MESVLLIKIYELRNRGDLKCCHSLTLLDLVLFILGTKIKSAKCVEGHTPIAISMLLCQTVITLSQVN